MWICPNCGRKFQNELQAHSCRPTLTIDEAFAGRKAVWLDMYKQIEAVFWAEAAPFDVHVTKNAVYWRHDSSFAAFLPKVKALELELRRDGFDSSVPAFKHMEMSPHRVSHYITVDSGSDVSRIVKWLSESYEMTKIGIC